MTWPFQRFDTERWRCFFFLTDLAKIFFAAPKVDQEFVKNSEFLTCIVESPECFLFGYGLYRDVIGIANNLIVFFRCVGYKLRQKYVFFFNTQMIVSKHQRSEWKYSTFPQTRGSPSSAPVVRRMRFCAKELGDACFKKRENGYPQNGLTF